jgi:hypothetical protein
MYHWKFIKNTLLTVYATPNLKKKQVYSISPKFVALLETGLIEVGKKKAY